MSKPFPDGMKMKLTKVLQIIAGILVAAAGILVFIKQVDIQDMAAKIKAIEFWKIAAVILLNIATLLMRAIRWRFILPKRKTAIYNGLFPLVTIGFMVNNFIPARIGEAVRVALLWRRNRFSFAESAGSVLLERFLDTMVFALFLCIPLFMLPQLYSLHRYGMFIGAGLLLALLLFFLYAKNNRFVKRIALRMIAVMPPKVRNKIMSIGRELLSNLEWLFSIKKTVIVVILSFLTIFCQIGMFLVLGYGIHGFGFFVSMFGVACAALGAAIPLSPGYVGTLHAALSSGLLQAGIDKGDAGAVAVLYHALGYITISVLGIFYYFRLKITLADVQNAKKNGSQ